MGGTQGTHGNKRKL